MAQRSIGRGILLLVVGLGCAAPLAQETKAARQMSLELCAGVASTGSGQLTCIDPLDGVAAGTAFSILGAFAPTQQESVIRIVLEKDDTDESQEFFLSSSDDDEEVLILGKGERSFHYDIGAARPGSFTVAVEQFALPTYEQLVAAEAALDAFLTQSALEFLEAEFPAVANETDLSADLSVAEALAFLESQSPLDDDMQEIYEQLLGTKTELLAALQGANAASLAIASTSVEVTDERPTAWTAAGFQPVFFDLAAVRVAATKTNLAEDNYEGIPDIVVQNSFQEGDKIWVQVALAAVTKGHFVSLHLYRETGSYVTYTAMEGTHWVRPRSLLEGRSWSWGSGYFDRLDPGKYNIDVRVDDADTGRGDCNQNGFRDPGDDGCSMWTILGYDCDGDKVLDASCEATRQEAVPIYALPVYYGFAPTEIEQRSIQVEVLEAPATDSETGN